MWTMLWIITLSAGGITSGVAEFPTKDACEAAALQLKQVNQLAGEAASINPPIATVRCIQKATGKP
jgi:hypothetical protein